MNPGEGKEASGGGDADGQIPRPFRFFVSHFFILSFCAAGLASQAKPRSGDEPPIRQEVTVTLKLIQVYVNDENGKPVPDLESSDFAILDNGKPQKITEFERHILATAVAPREPAAPVAQDRMTRKFFLFFDLAFNDVHGIAMAKKTALDFIDSQAGTTDEIGVISYAVGKGLRLHEYLTGDRAKSREAILDIGAAAQLGRAGRLLEELTSEKSAKMDMMGFQGEPRKAKENAIRNSGIPMYRQEVQAFSSAVRDFAKALRTIPGYKHIVLFSKGVPDFLMYQRADDIAGAIDVVNMNASDGLDLRLRFERAIRELSSADCPVLAVNVEGLSTRFKEMEFGDVRSPSSSQLDPSPFMDRTGKGDGSLREMAKLSGGKYFGDSNDTGRIAQEIQEYTGSYYVLGYAIDEKWDGKYHRLEVKIRRPGTNARFQQGYFNPMPFAKLSDFEKNLHLIDLALGGRTYFSEPVDFPMTALVNPSRSGTELVMFGRVSGERLRRVSGSKLEIVALVFDKDRNLTVQRRLEVDAAKISADAAFCVFSSPASPGDYECRIVIRDLTSGASALGSSSVRVPRRFEPGIRLYPALLLDPGERAIYLNDAEAGPEGTARTLTDLYSFDLERQVPLMNEIDGSATRLLALLPCSVIRFEPKNVLLSARLVNLSSAEKRELPMSVIEQHQQDDTIVFKLELQMEKLPAGKYSLYFFAEDGETHQAYSFTARTIAIK